MSLSPLRQAFSGQTDSNGNATVTIPVKGTNYVVGNIVGQTAGNAAWTVSVGGQAVYPGKGPSVVLGPILVAPNEQITIVLTGGLPTQPVTGTLVGVQSSQLDDVMQVYSPVAHPLALDTVSLRHTLYPDGTTPSQMGPAPTFPSFTVGASGGATKTFTLLPNQTAIRISQNGSTQFRLQVAGHQTGDGYLQSVDVNGGSNFLSANSPFRPIDIRVEPSWDPQVDITFTEESGNAATIYVSALVGAETTVIAGATTQIPVYFLPTGAALWQAPNLMPIRVANLITGGAANRVQLVAGVAGQSVYVLSASLGFDTITGGSVSLCDGDPNAGGTRRIDFETAVLNPAPYMGPGKAFTSGNGLFIMADNTVTVRGTVAASQG